MHLGYFSVCILFVIHAGHKIGIHQPDFISRKQPEIFLRRILHEIFPVNIQLPAERDFPGSHFLIFRIVDSIDPFHLIFRIIVDDQLYRIQHSHITRHLRLQIFPDAVLQHCVIRRALCFGNTGKFDKHADGFRRKASSSERCDRHQAGIIPAVDHAVRYQLLDIAFSGDHAGQVHLGKFNLPRRLLKADVFHDPVI